MMRVLSANTAVQMTPQLHADLRIAWKLLGDAGHDAAADRVFQFLNEAAAAGDALPAVQGKPNASKGKQIVKIELPLPAAVKNGWERLTPEAFERIRKAGYGEGGTLWLCVPSKHGKTPDVVQGDYVGMAFYPGTQEMREAFKTDIGQFISVCDVSHTMSFHPPAPPELD